MTQKKTQASDGSGSAGPYAHAPSGGSERQRAWGPSFLLETATHARDGVADVLAQDDPAAVQFDLQHGALGQAERIAHGFRQRDLAAFGDSGFHVRPLV